MENLNAQTRIRYRIMRNLVGSASEKKILDIGAGKNPISKNIKTKETIRLDGVKDYNPDIYWDINKGLPLEKGSVDIIIAGEIIEHLYNPIRFVRECNRILKKGGFLILSTPNTCSLKSRFKVLFGQLPEGGAIPLDKEIFERHVVDFNIPELSKILKNNKFKVIEKTSNGIILHSKLLFPLFLTPATFGETIIIKCIKEN